MPSSASEFLLVVFVHEFNSKQMKTIMAFILIKYATKFKQYHGTKILLHLVEKCLF